MRFPKNHQAAPPPRTGGNGSTLGPVRGAAAVSQPLSIARELTGGWFAFVGHTQGATVYDTE